MTPRTDPALHPRGPDAGEVRLREVRRPGGLPLYAHPGWADRFPWLVQGTTARGEAGDPYDFGVFGPDVSRLVLRRWRALRRETGFDRVVHAGQVHGDAVLRHGPMHPGLFVADAADGHVTTEPGILLTVSLADCVPVFLVDPGRRAVALLHGGWRGIAAGILESGLRALRSAADSEAADLHLHLGPSICGACYEVGPEVHDALGLEPPAAPRPVDLRAVLVTRAARLGIPPDRVTRSEHCTRCAGSPFFSHRAGHPERQLGILGIRPPRG